MISAIFALLAFELLGEILREALHLPVPGPVLGMLGLTVAVAMLMRSRKPDVTAFLAALGRTADMLLRHMGLLFVPAGVGLIAEADLLRREWLPIVAGVIVSTVLSLVVTGVVLHHAAVRTRFVPTVGRPRGIAR